MAVRPSIDSDARAAFVLCVHAVPEPGFHAHFRYRRIGFWVGEIYTPNTFSGNDRIADANRVTLGLTSRLMIAQQYYFRQQRLTLKPGQARAQANHSDLLLGAAWNPNGALSAETTL